MPELTPEQQEQYQKDYDAEMERLDAAESGNAGTTTAAAVTPPAETIAADAANAPGKTDLETPVETVEELKARLAKAEKEARDNKAWGTRNAQEAAELKRQQRELNKPELLVQTPGLEESIRHVAGIPETPQEPTEQQRNEQWTTIIDKAHPDVFKLPETDELITALKAKREELGDDWNDPLIAIREITAVKLAHTERQIGQRFAQEAAKLAKKSAMSVPGAGSSGARVATTDDDAQKEVDRILNMSDADFAKEVARAKGY